MAPSSALAAPGPLHPSAQRLGDLLEFVRSEFEQVTNESGALRAQREEYEAMSESPSFPSWPGAVWLLLLGLVLALAGCWAAFGWGWAWMPRG